ncbi:hypothetical protein CANINC_001721 [Pichia inconspicua]|uniref:Nuclear pore complex protein n=1 Tax=Pichia inconspicua TaxID=52247 RepID=A0A4T0X317_9ASCO|nr:hypothetical protein CANINC_001721 [[Candida] inconspicua]
MNSNSILESIELSVEDDDLHTQFAKVLREFRVEFGKFDLGSLASKFKIIAHRKLLEVYSKDSTQIEDIENWTLECKFWTLMEALQDVKFNKELLDDDMAMTITPEFNDVCEYSSDIFIIDKMIASDIKISQLLVTMSTLSETFKLDIPPDEDEELDLQTTKWLNTLNNLNSMSPNPEYVDCLDIDAPTRTDHAIDPVDAEKDELFFKKAFSLLLSNELEDLNELCKITNNWDFAMILAGFSDRVDPIMDLNDFQSGTKPSGVKSQILRKRTLYQLIQSVKSSKATGKYELACYGYLVNDFMSCHELASNWEEKLLIYLRNYLNIKLEDQLVKIHTKFNIESSDLAMIHKLPKPPIMTNSVDDILMKLSNDTDDRIKEQSKHPIRVLMGSLISDNVKDLMNNTIKSLENMVQTDGQDSILADTYVLRILTHVAIILQLVYGEKLISNDDYTKLLNFYIHRLTLYKSYELIPTYMSYIPEESDIIRIYSGLIMKFEFEPEDRAKQISGIRHLVLPLENILRTTIERAFEETAQYYPTNKEVVLVFESVPIDKKLYQLICWFIDANMVDDAIDSIAVLLRRFLLVGKIGASIEFIDSMNLPFLIENYQIKHQIQDDINVIKPIMELIQYKNFIAVFKSMINFDPNSGSFEEIFELSKKIRRLIKYWLFELSNDVEQENKDVFNELRRIYIPVLFNKLFELLIENKYQDEVLIKEGIDMVNLLADEEYKLYEIFDSTNELEPFLIKFANISCNLYGAFEKGIYLRD